MVLCTLPHHVLYMYQVSQKFHNEFPSYGADMTSMSKFTRGCNSIKNEIKLWFLIYVYCLMLSGDSVYLYQVSQKYLKCFTVIVQT